MSLFVAMAAALIASCGDSPARSELEPMPDSDLAAFEASVRSQLGAAEGEVESAAAGRDDEALADAYGELGRRLHAYELHEAAAVAYRNAVHLRPQEFRWLYHLGILHQATGELDDAARILERALEAKPEDLPARVRLGEIRIGQGEMEAAAGELQRALELDPECALAHLFLGNLANAAGDPREAARRYERALQLQPQATAVHSPLAVVYSSLGEEELAASHLALRGRQVVQLLDPLALALGELHVGAVGRIRRGARAQIEGDLTTARQEYTQAVAADPANPEARQSLGSVLAQLGETDAAINEYRAALDITGESALVLANLGGLLIETADRAEGIRKLERALELDPTLLKAHLAMGQVGLWQESYDLAEDHYRQVLERDAANVSARLGLARTLAASGRRGDAVAELSRGLGRDPSPADAAVMHQEIASQAGAAGELELSLEHLDRALELDPQLDNARFARANLRGQTGRYREAADDYAVFLVRHPESVVAHLGQATALALAGEFVTAIERLGEGLDSRPGDPNLLHTLARLLVTAPDPAARNPQRALELSRRALEITGSPQVSTTVALALAADGRCAEAIAHERRLLEESRANGDRAFVDSLRLRLEHFETTGRCLEPWS